MKPHVSGIKLDLVSNVNCADRSEDVSKNLYFRTQYQILALNKIVTFDVMVIIFVFRFDLLCRGFLI
jgi:hypothetical protein